MTDEEKIISHGDDEHLLQQPIPPVKVQTLVLAVHPPVGHNVDDILEPAPSQKYPVPQLAVVHDPDIIPNPIDTQVPNGHGVFIPSLQK